MHWTKYLHRVGLGIGLFVIGVVFSVLPVQAGGYFYITDVTGLIADNSLCSLPEAIINADSDNQTYGDCPIGSGDDIINLSGQTITLTSQYTTYGGYATGLPIISTTMKIQNGTITRSSANEFRLLYVANTGSLTLDNMMLTNGGGATYTGNGGAILNDGGDLTITNSTLNSNLTSALGGAVYTSSATINDDTLITNTYLQGNQASSGGALYLAGDVTIYDSLITGNLAANGDGGGVATNSTSSKRIENTTIAGNHATNRGGGAFLLAGTFYHSIIYDNTDSGTDGADIYVESGHSSVSTSIYGSHYNAQIQSSSLSADPLFVAPVAANNAPTINGDYSLQFASPAINLNSSITIIDPTRKDVASNPRYLDPLFNAGGIDAGAYEYQLDTVCATYETAFNTAAPYVIGTNFSALEQDIVGALVCANGNDTDDVIDLNGQTIIFTEIYTNDTAVPIITTNITIQNGAMVRSGANEFRFLFATGMSHLIVDNMEFSNGGSTYPPFVGGAIYSNSTLTVKNSFIHDQISTAVRVNAGTMTMSNSILQANNGAISAASSFYIQNSLITGNTGGINNYITLNNIPPSTITNSTIAGNLYGGVAQHSNGYDHVLYLNNNIVHSNGDGNLDGHSSGYDIHQDNLTTIYLQNTLYGTLYGPVIDLGNNIVSDPQFIDPLAASAAPSIGGDYHLQISSPAIDTGDNNEAVDSNDNPLLTDLDDHARILNTTVDMGAYETPSVDIDSNGLITPVDAIFVINRVGLTPTGGDAPADVDGDGDIDNDDAQAVLLYLGMTP